MRFLLHPTRIPPTAKRILRGHDGVVKIDPSTTSSFASKQEDKKGYRTPDKNELPTGGVNTRNNHPSSTSTTDSSRRIIHKWGQHYCGISCSCILRLDVTIDPYDGVVTSAQYKAKSFLRLFHWNRQQHHNQYDSSNTSTTITTTLSPSTALSQRVFLTECSCTSLHKLAQKTCAYQLHRNVFQIMNNLHTSDPIKTHIAKTQRITNSHCYDVLHATLYALWHQRSTTIDNMMQMMKKDLPKHHPFQTPPGTAQSAQNQSTLSSSNLSLSDDEEHIYTYHHRQPTKNTDSATATSNEPLENSWTWPSWWTTNHNYHYHNEDEEDNNNIHHSFMKTKSTSNAPIHSQSSSLYYGALLQHLDRLEEDLTPPAAKHMSHHHGITNDGTRITHVHRDWVSYVDEMQDQDNDWTKTSAY